MAICIGCNSALEIYRSYGRLIPELLERRRTSKLDDCSLPSPLMLEDEMSRAGAYEKPYHLVFGNPCQAGPRPDVKRHTLVGALPRRAFVHMKKDVLLASPELMFVQLAASGDYDEIDLALVGYEICGTYVLDQDEDSWDGMINTTQPMTSTDKIQRMIAALSGRTGVKKAAVALSLVNDGSNSPMETILALLLTLPQRLGGLNLGPITMNKHVATSTGDRWVDVYFEGHNVGLEYKGREPHSLEKVGRDDRRQNKLVSSGVTILNVWYEDLADSHLFDQLVSDIASALGKRIRSRSNKFNQRQRLLRQRLLPSIRRYGGLAA